MTADDKKRLLDLLANAHSILRTTVEGIDPELRVHTDSGWRIRDIIGHIATWDREVVKSLSAFQAGTEYSVPDLDEDAFNQQAAMVQQELTARQVFSEWEQSRDDLKAPIKLLILRNTIDRDFQGKDPAEAGPYAHTWLRANLSRKPVAANTGSRRSWKLRSSL